MKKVFEITGMTCASCAAHVEKAVKKLGVSDVSVNLLTEKMTVESDLSDGDIIAAVVGAGYGATVVGGARTDTATKAGKSGKTGKGEKSGKEKNSQTLLTRFVASLVFLLPLMYFSMGHMAGFPLGAFDPHADPASFALIQFVLTTPVLVINGRFFVSGVRSAIKLAPSMDTLVSLGSGAAYIYGVAMMFVINAEVAAGDLAAASADAMGLFFESAATILTLVTLGKFLEAKSKNRTRSEVDKLMRLRPQTATVLRDGKEMIVPVDEIAVGDDVAVLSGQYVPCDGVIKQGATTLDLSAVTGEPLPVEATVGDGVTSAALNLTGRVVISAERVGADSTLGRIIELIENAGGSKAPIQKIADRVSAVFVPTVTAIALVTFFVWLFIGSVADAFTYGISVLVISCPCALGLATPVAVMAGMGRAAAYGVLVKNAETLQGLRSVKVYALDKTATITEGKPRLTDVTPYGDYTREKVLAVAAALEKTSTHPLASAIVAACPDVAPASDSEYKVGYGVGGTVDGVKYWVGGERLLSSLGIAADECEDQTVFVCRDGQIVGRLTVEDELKPTSAAAVSLLKRMGARVVMLTGDSKPRARRIAAQVGISEVYCNVLPEDKLNIVKQLKSSGKTAMVGDGINDAPALKEADIGIAIGSGTDVAIEAADVVLVKSDLADVPRAAAVSRLSLRNIKQNLFWAFIYNTLGIPLAAGVFAALGVALDPMIAAGAMVCSSLFVVCNALRLTVMRFDDKHLAAKLGHKREKAGGKTGDGTIGITLSDMDKKGEDMTVRLKVDGMSCGHCSARVQKALEGVHGVTHAEVDLASGVAAVTGDFDTDQAIQAVENAGYECKKL